MMKKKKSRKRIVYTFGGIVVLWIVSFVADNIIFQWMGEKNQNADDIISDTNQDFGEQNKESQNFGGTDGENSLYTMIKFTEIRELVTAKDETNLRDKPSQGSDSKIMYILMNGQEAMRTGVSDSGWSRVEYKDGVYYAVSSLLTTDFGNADSTPTPTPMPTSTLTPGDEVGVQTEFKEVNHKVTAKDVVNLRTLPSVTHEDSVVVGQMKNGDIAVRTGINIDLGWSRVEFDGQILYCVSRYLVTAE